MNLWSSLNGNLGKAPEQAAAVDMDKNRVKGPSDDLLVDPTDLGKASKKSMVLPVIAAVIVGVFVFNVISKWMANGNSEVFAVTVLNNGAVVELYENPMKVNAFENGEWFYEENPSVSKNLAGVVEQFPVVAWNETFEMAVADGTKLKWFDLYDENLTCVCHFAVENEVKNYFTDAEAGTYYVIAGARWEGKYVLRSFTNESFTKEFCVAVVKE